MRFTPKTLAIALGVVTLLLIGGGSVFWWSARRQKMRNWHELVQGSIPADRADVRVLMELPHKIRETSGLAVSVQNPGLFWTHNDSGHDPVVYGLRLGLGIVAELRLKGAPASDWEDLSLGPCPRNEAKPCLYVADIGDNLGIRSSLALLVVEEPRLDPDVVVVTEVDWSSVAMSYEDGPRDAEAIAVDEGGEIVVVEKNVPEGLRLYRADADDVFGPPEGGRVEGGRFVLKHAATLPIRPVRGSGGLTAAAFTKGGELIVRSYGEAFFFRREGLGWVETRPPCFIGHAGFGGEALDVGPSGVLYLTREAVWRQPAGLDRAVCPAEGE